MLSIAPVTITLLSIDLRCIESALEQLVAGLGTPNIVLFADDAIAFYLTEKPFHSLGAMHQNLNRTVQRVIPNGIPAGDAGFLACGQIDSGIQLRQPGKSTHRPDRDARPPRTYRTWIWAERTATSS